MITYNALKVDGLKDVLQNIATACDHLNIDFFVVGAVARNIWYVHGGKESRGTQDIDFGVYVPDHETYDDLKNYLTENFKYTQAQDNIFGLDTPEGKGIDLLPFGEIAENDEVVMEGRGMTKIKLDGFKEAYLNGSINTNIEEEAYKACSIPGIVILKLIAYDDRPDRRTKDIKDISLICKYFPDIETNLIWEEHYDLYEEDRSHDEVGYIVLGREMKKIIKDNNGLFERVYDILNKAINGQSGVLELMINDRIQETLDQKVRILECIKEGLGH
ncbi:MAG TPA: nucleotidyl transferase AbiEii/AbiGii toxin family protein [Saprospiraceae bacterium]|nr:nucleotidyl transferase AbiEii/AbiGii toxin family protein [Saprospiraceae bacterium]